MLLVLGKSFYIHIYGCEIITVENFSWMHKVQRETYEFFL